VNKNRMDINKIVKWCLEHGLREPDFEEIAGGFLVGFYAPEDILSLIPEPGKINLEKLGLNERQIKALGLMVNEGKVFTNKEYQVHFGVSNSNLEHNAVIFSHHHHILFRNNLQIVPPILQELCHRCPI